MKTKEFIEQVISGEQGIFDVLDYASHVKRDYNGDIQALADDLFLLAHGALLYGRTQAVSDSEEIDRLEKAASVICEAYGLDWMETGSPTLQELEDRQVWISKKLECLEALEQGSEAVGNLIASKPELSELMERIQVASEGVSDTTGEPRDTKATMELYQKQLAEITAEIEQVRQQETERAAAKPGTDPDHEERQKNDHYATTNKNIEECGKVFQSLVEAGYIDRNTTLFQWLAVCGKSNGSEAAKAVCGEPNNSAVAKINWISDVKLLGYFIDKFWGDENSNCLWEIMLSNVEKISCINR